MWHHVGASHAVCVASHDKPVLAPKKGVPAFLIRNVGVVALKRPLSAHLRQNHLMDFRSKDGCARNTVVTMSGCAKFIRHSDGRTMTAPVAVCRAPSVNQRKAGHGCRRAGAFIKSTLKTRLRHWLALTLMNVRT